MQFLHNSFSTMGLWANMHFTHQCIVSPLSFFSDPFCSCWWRPSHTQKRALTQGHAHTHAHTPRHTHTNRRWNSCISCYLQVIQVLWLCAFQQANMIAIQPSGVWFRVFYCEPRPIWVSALTWVVSKGDEAGIQKQKLLWATKRKEKKRNPHKIDIGNKNIDWCEIFLWIAHFLCIFWTDLNQF